MCNLCNRKKYGRVTKKSFENNVITGVTDVTRKNHHVRNDIDAEEWHEAYEGRAAIMQHLGELPRQKAEQQARVICFAEFRKRKQSQ